MTKPYSIRQTRQHENDSILKHLLEVLPAKEVMK